MNSIIQKHGKEIRRELRNGKFDVQTEQGIISMFHGGLTLRGEYEEDVNGEDVRRHSNLITDVGIRYFLDMLDGSTAKISSWYLGWMNNATPLAAWTVNDFHTNENTSTVAGYTGANRAGPLTIAPATNNYIDNYASKASFTVAGTVSVYGLGLMSTQARSATTGTLISATAFGTPRALLDLDVWNVGYRLILASS